jgi:hypothetical protein
MTPSLTHRYLPGVREQPQRRTSKNLFQMLMLGPSDPLLSFLSGTAGYTSSNLLSLVKKTWQMES